MASLRRYRNALGVVAQLDAEGGARAVKSGWVAIRSTEVTEGPFAEAAPVVSEFVPEAAPEAIPEPEAESTLPGDDSDAGSVSVNVESEDFTNSDAGLSEAAPVKRGRPRKPVAN